MPVTHSIMKSSFFSSKKHLKVPSRRSLAAAAAAETTKMRVGEATYSSAAATADGSGVSWIDMSGNYQGDAARKDYHQGSERHRDERLL